MKHGNRQMVKSTNLIRKASNFFDSRLTQLILKGACIQKHSKNCNQLNNFFQLLTFLNSDI